MSEAKRVLLTDRQCRLFLNDVQEFGYTNATFDEIRQIANQVAGGSYDKSDPVAMIMVKQIDEAAEMVAARRHRR